MILEISWPRVVDCQVTSAVTLPRLHWNTVAALRCQWLWSLALESSVVVPVALEPGFGKIGCSVSPSPLLSLP